MGGGRPAVPGPECVDPHRVASMSAAARHFESVPVERLGPAGIDEVLSRTDLEEAAALLRAVRADPSGPLAQRVLEVCAHREGPIGTVEPLVIGRWGGGPSGALAAPCRRSADRFVGRVEAGTGA